MLPALEIKVLPKDMDEEGFEKSTLSGFLKGKSGIIDLWHTKCTRCPAALDKLNKQASSCFGDRAEDVVFLSLALSQGEGDIDMVRELTGE